LFHAREGSRAWDQGPRSFQCSRRMDVLKVWVALQRYGAEGLGAIYDHLCATARDLHGLIARRSDFEALHEPESNILCFRFRGDGALAPERLDVLNLKLREEFNRSGQGWITTTLLGGRRVLRVTVMNPRTRTGDVQAVLDGLGRMGGELLNGSGGAASREGL
ncbi:MAG: hypothetical protein IPN83_13225, partial [Holophagales bacterium]|nr:hypothetical protein [Holophagales bacterium]